MKYLYDNEGCTIWTNALRTSEYYVMKAEEEILNQRSEAILSLMDKDEFLLIDIGAGTG